MEDQEKSLYRYELVRKAPDGEKSRYQFTYDGNPINYFFSSTSDVAERDFNKALNDHLELADAFIEESISDVRERHAKGYTIALYGTRDALYQQMLDDITLLLGYLD